MRKQLFAAMLAVAAIPGLAPGADQSAPQTHAGAVAEGTPAAAPAEPRARVNWDSACTPADCFWVRAEYLMWWIKDSQIPALVTTGVPGTTVLPGALGQPGTTVLFGGSNVENQLRSGGRFTAGFWCDDCQTVGLEGSYFFLAPRSVRFNSGSAGTLSSPFIARPFFDVLTGAQNSQLVAFPGLASGNIHVNSTSRLQGADLNLLCVQGCTPCCDPCPDPCAPGACNTRPRCVSRVSLLAGFRWLQLDESLGITEVSRVNPILGVPPGVFAGSPLFGGSTIIMTDQFDVQNNFYGGQVGARAELCWGRMFVDVQGKVALGTTNQVVEVRGSTSITNPAGTTVVTPAGFLATGSNSGRFTRDQFAVVPEVGVNVGYQCNRHLRAFVGYTFLYWSSVVRPGDQVDVALSGTQIPTHPQFNPAAGPARPAAILRDTDFWAQGINFGLEFRY